MSVQTGTRRAPSAARQRGQAIFLAAVLLLLGISAVIYTTMSSTSVSIANRQAEAASTVLVQARDALIGRAASDDNRPGSLSCPDFDDGTLNPINVANDGIADVMVGNACPSYIGRLPWRTLRLPDLRDSSGERLWYALSNNFQDASGMVINSDTKGNRTVHGGSTAVTLTAEAVAVIFAPGVALGAQVRDATPALCPTTGTTIARNLCAANYLDATGGADNALVGGAGPFVSAQRSDTFNDSLLVITTYDLMPAVEQRVARELRKILQDYKANTACACTNLGATAGCYPWADLSDGYSDAPPWWPVGQGRNRGRIPAFGAAPHDWGTNPCGSPVPTLPSWFVNNDWRLVVYYSAGRNFLGPGACNSCVDWTLTVSGVAGKEVVILMPGPLLGVPPRAPVLLDDSTYWQYYFEDPVNQDFANDVYVTPTSTAYTRDRIFTIP